MMAEEYGEGDLLVLFWKGRPIQRDKDHMTLGELGMKSNHMVAISRQLGQKTTREEIQVCVCICLYILQQITPLCITLLLKRPKNLLEKYCAVHIRISSHMNAARLYSLIVTFMATRS